MQARLTDRRQILKQISTFEWKGVSTQVFCATFLEVEVLTSETLFEDEEVSVHHRIHWCRRVLGNCLHRRQHSGIMEDGLLDVCGRVMYHVFVGGGAFDHTPAIRAGAEFPARLEPGDRQVQIGFPVNSRKVCARIVIGLKNRDGLSSSI